MCYEKLGMWRILRVCFHRMKAKNGDVLYTPYNFVTDNTSLLYENRILCMFHSLFYS